jgi:UDP-N-acetylglucosamine--N-acetylmuramyl-(pentapeptide) pyrophosphoryl-undecaprenol N-acetylglucosamine transferase
MKLLIVAGGGGHFAAALAVIQQLPKDWQLLVVGRKYTFENDQTLSFEYQTAKKLGIPFQPLKTGRLQRRVSAKSFASLMKVPGGFSQAFHVVRNYQPDVVLSFGGYVSVPVAYAARLFRIPIVVHEQILGAGLANKVAAKFAKKVCVSWEQSTRFFPKEKVVLTGNPVRSVLTLSKDRPHPVPPLSSKRAPSHSLSPLPFLSEEGSAASKKPMIYVTGGSGGAHAINVLIEGCLEKLLERFTVVHQTGDAQEFGDFDRLTAIRAQLPEALQKRYILAKFVPPAEVFTILQTAALVISRSGMNTVTELLSFNKPCLLIPLPFGQKNEQLENALFVKKLGLGEVAEQNSLTPERVYHLVTNMTERLASYTSHEEAIKKVLKPDAAERIVEVVANVYQQTKAAKA